MGDQRKANCERWYYDLVQLIGKPLAALSWKVDGPAEDSTTWHRRFATLKEMVLSIELINKELGDSAGAVIDKILSKFEGTDAKGIQIMRAELASALNDLVQQQSAAAAEDDDSKPPF